MSARIAVNGFLNIVTGTSRNLTYAALTVAAFSLGAKLLGLIRDRLLASTFGAGDVLDIYFAGFRLPDLLFNLFALGAVSAGFLPVFTERYAKNPEDAWRMAGNFLTLLLAALAVAAAVLFIAAPLLLHAVAPGFDADKITRAAHVTRLLLLSPLLFGFSSVLGAILQHAGRFFAYALAPVFYNIGIIAGIVILGKTHEEQGIVAGVLLGAALHVAIQLFAAAKSGFRFAPRFKPVHEAVGEILRLSGPRTLNLVVNQISIIAMTAIASTIAAGSVAVFMLAENLQALPVDMIGVSFAVAAFPALTRAALASRKEAAALLAETLQRVLFLVIPASVLIYVLRAQIVRVLYGAGLFSWDDTRLVAAAVAAFTLGIAGFAALPLLIRAFFAMKDTVTPFLVALLGAFFSIAGALFLASLITNGHAVSRAIHVALRIQDLDGTAIVAIPLALSFAVYFQVLALIAALRVIAGFEMGKLVRAVMRVLAASLLAGGTSWVSLQLFGSSVQTDTFFKVLAHGALGGIVGLTTYFGIAFVFRFPEVSELLNGLRKHS